MRLQDWGSGADAKMWQRRTPEKQQLEDLPFIMLHAKWPALLVKDRPRAGKWESEPLQYTCQDQNVENCQCLVSKGCLTAASAMVNSVGPTLATTMCLEVRKDERLTSHATGRPLSSPPLCQSATHKLRAPPAPRCADRRADNEVGSTNRLAKRSLPPPETVRQTTVRKASH